MKFFKLFIIFFAFSIPINSAPILEKLSFSSGLSRYSNIDSTAYSLNYQLNEKLVSGIRYYSFIRSTSLDGVSPGLTYSKVEEVYRFQMQTLFLNYFIHKFIYLGLQVSNFNYFYKNDSVILDLNRNYIRESEVSIYFQNQIKLFHFSFGFHYNFTSNLSISLENSFILNHSHKLETELMNYSPVRDIYKDYYFLSQIEDSSIDLPRRIQYLYVTIKM
jgi:hypothetical protein